MADIYGFGPGWDLPATVQDNVRQVVRDWLTSHPSGDALVNQKITALETGKADRSELSGLDAKIESASLVKSVLGRTGAVTAQDFIDAGLNGSGGSLELQAAKDYTDTLRPLLWTRGRVTSGMDVRGAALGAWTVGSAGEFDSLVNKPPATYRGAAIFEVFQFANTFKAIRWTYIPTTGTPVQLVSTQFSSGWTPWESLSWNKGEVPTGADVQTLPAGEWSVRSFATFDSLKNAPPEARGIGTITVLELTATARTIKWVTAPSTGDPKVFYGYSLTGAFVGWLDWTPGPAAPLGSALVDTSNSAITTNPVNAGLRNGLLREAFFRRYRTSTGGKAVVSLRFDDGHNAFKTDVLPLLREFGFPYSIAVCSRRWDHPENNLVTPTEMAGWVANDKAEIWNHTATHREGDGPTDEIVEGLRELRAQLPSAEIWGWYAPGIENGYGGMLPTREPHNLSGTLGGQLALANHALVSGYITGSARRPIEPMPSTVAGFAHYSMDGKAAAELVAEVDTVITEKARENFMMHPSRLGLANGVTKADLRAFFVKLQAEVAAGRLLVLSPYQMEAVTI